MIYELMVLVLDLMFFFWKELEGQKAPREVGSDAGDEFLSDTPPYMLVK